MQDNLFLGREKTVRWAAEAAESRRRWRNTPSAASCCERVGLPVDVPVPQPVGDLPPGQKQLVEIARSLGLNAKLLIMDEPTISL